MEILSGSERHFIVRQTTAERVETNANFIFKPGDTFGGIDAPATVRNRTYR